MFFLLYTKWFFETIAATIYSSRAQYFIPFHNHKNPTYHSIPQSLGLDPIDNIVKVSILDNAIIFTTTKYESKQDWTGKIDCS